MKRSNLANFLLSACLLVFAFFFFILYPKPVHAQLTCDEVQVISCNSDAITFKFKFTSDNVLSAPSPNDNVFSYSDYSGSCGSPNIEIWNMCGVGGYICDNSCGGVAWAGHEGELVFNLDPSNYLHEDPVTLYIPLLTFHDPASQSVLYGDPDTGCGGLIGTCNFIDLDEVPCIPAASECDPAIEDCFCVSSAECCGGLSCDPMFGHCAANPNPTLCADGVSINTGIGCIDVENLGSFTASTLNFGIGIGGGIAFLLMVMAGIMIKTSAGDPKRLQAGRELLFAAIAGLILIVFSVFLLRVIGVNIFGIPEL